jgi:2-oxoisovalerate dehydrogenase E1 component
MQAIPTTGVAMGVSYLEHRKLGKWKKPPVVVCSLGDAAITEGEVSEALQMAALRKLPILFFIQDNEWDISANASETRAMNAAEYAAGFKGIEVRSIERNEF